MKNMRQTMLAAVAAVAATIPVTAITPGRAGPPDGLVVMIRHTLVALAAAAIIGAVGCGPAAADDMFHDHTETA